MIHTLAMVMCLLVLLFCSLQDPCVGLLITGGTLQDLDNSMVVWT